MLKTVQRLMASSSERNRIGSSRLDDSMTRRVVPIEDIFASRKGVMWNERVSMLHAGRQSQLSNTCSVQVDKAAKKNKPKKPIPLAAIDIYNVRVLDAVDQAAFKFSRDTLDTATKDLKTAIKDLKKVLKTGISKNQAIGYIAKRVEKIFADPMRAYRIATTEISRAQHAGQLMVAKESGVVTHKTWLASSDACDQCLDLDGRSVGLEEPFYVDPKGGSYAEVQFPPMHPHCLLPETTVISPRTVMAMKSYFSGTCYRVEFSDGYNLSCTPNHMLLTPGGFLPAKSLMEGDYIVCRSHINRVLSSGPYDNWSPSRIKDKFNSLLKSVGMSTSTVPVSSEYLHGDAAFCQGNINVVGSYSLLRNVLNFWEDYKYFVEEPLLQDFHFAESFDSNSLFDFSGHFNRLASLCGMGSLRHFHSLLNSHDRVGLQTVPSINFGPTQGIDNSMGSTSVSFSESSGGDSLRIFIDELLNRNIVKLLSLRHVKPFQYEGLVYDLMTQDSLYYTANGVVNSNCMCTMTEDL